MNKILLFLLMPFIWSIFDYILYLIFKDLKLYKVSLYFLATSYAPILTEKRAKKVYDYCKEYCPNKSCEKCLYWTCKSEKNDK